MKQFCLVTMKFYYQTINVFGSSVNVLEQNFLDINRKCKNLANKWTLSFVVFIIWLAKKVCRKNVKKLTFTMFSKSKAAHCFSKHCMIIFVQTLVIIDKNKANNIFCCNQDLTPLKTEAVLSTLIEQTFFPHYLMFFFIIEFNLLEYRATFQ